MSSRALKKLQGAAGKDLMLDVKDDVDDNQLSDDDDELEVARGKHLNPFDLLNQQSLSESEVKEDDNETEHASTAANQPSGAGGVGAAKQKKKKKRKKKTKYTGNHISSEDNELTDKYLSDIDSLIGKVHDATNQNQKLNPPRIEIDKSLLTVELKHLNQQNELRRTFGKRVVKIENKRGRQKLTLKSTYMVTAKESWPPITKNIITMKPVQLPEQLASTSSSHSASEKTQWFAFEHSQFYQSVQNLFLQAVERADSDFFISLIRRCPYHVDSLIQLSELCKITENYSLASELIERAVLVLESSLHPSFSLTSGNCRLDYRRQENRSFFITLFKHAQYLEARACCRTAFELSKLILSLNPEVDPLAIVLIIDYYALRSKQYAWLIKFYEEYDAVRNLSQLPNMAYSYALALFCQTGECEKSDKALQYALLMFPGVLRPLLDELSVQTDKRVQASSYFNTSISSSQSPSLHQLVALYICRAKVVWRQNDMLPWLERNVNVVLDMVDQKDEVITDYNQKRAVRYVSPPRQILRHVILSDYKEKVPLAPFLAKEKDPLMMYDPLPPLDSVNCYERKSSSSSPTTGPNRSVFMFFESLMPSFNLNNRGGEEQQQQQNAVVEAVAVRANALPAPQANAGHDDDEVAQVDRHLRALNANLENAAAEDAAGGTEGGASYRELTHSLTNIVDAMRDFLQNFRIVEPMQAADGEENGSSEEDTSDYFD
ncbi:transcription factor 25 [Anastrepha obliqua]|uniref:transcription factor 25 n=1 Tax=Anastrepha obliqua TaxID=95512 RepID=UPI00240A33A5|nr:transcription factor 25 [Anastrepha obliqua]XP_054735842.1 transcription factor 25 [Anastrepha obliqua]XP_054735843.1 transcription factor 25 [Anastrepha obliqua]XP_054735844.1 transcription factor 25 [Anastrepha obliqua]